MRILAVALMALMVVLSASVTAVYAASTLLAREEMVVKGGDDSEAKTVELFKKTLETAEKHPCVEKAKSEGRLLEVNAKLDGVFGDDNLTLILELRSDGCD